MKKSQRIKASQEFHDIIQQKKYQTRAGFTVYIQPKKEIQSRVGISVPKRLAPAVLRNKTRRQIRNMLQGFDLKPFAYDVIILVRKQYFQQSFTDNQKDLEKLLKTVRI